MNEAGCMNEEDREYIHEILRIKHQLQRQVKPPLTLITEKDKDLHEILESVKRFLAKHCKHEYIVDYIDITPDRGTTVIYCELCETTI